MATYHPVHWPGLVLLTKAGQNAFSILSPRHSILAFVAHLALRSGKEATVCLCQEQPTCEVGMEKWRLRLFGAGYD